MNIIGGISLCCGLEQFSSFAMGTLKLISEVPTSSNPFEIATVSYSVALQTPVYNLKQLSEKTKVEMFGINSDQYWKATISDSSVSIVPNELVIITSDYLPTVKGKVARCDYQGNGLIEIYVNTSPQFPTQALSAL